MGRGVNQLVVVAFMSLLIFGGTLPAALATLSTTQMALSEPRIGMAVASIGTRALFAGGSRFTPDNRTNYSANVDIYDGATGQWRVASCRLGCTMG